MPFSGGTYQRSYNWVSDKNSSIPITASRMDTEDTGFATGLSTCILKDGTQTITADIPWNSHKITGLANGSAVQDAATVSQVQNCLVNWVASGGTADVITASYSPAITALVDGMELDFRATAANATTTPTFSPNGLTAHTITKKGGSALVANDIAAANAEYKLRYNLANTRWELLNPASIAPAANSVTNAMLAQAAALTIKGNNTTSTANEADLTGAQALSVLPIQSINDFRLTLTSVTPVTTGDVTGATTLYCTPYKGSNIALYDGSANWNVISSAEFSLALGTLTSGKPYDVFCFSNSGVPTLEFLVWTNDTTRATALVYQNGILVKSGATTRRYMGTFYTTATTTTEDSLTKRYLYNYYNRVIRPMQRLEGTASWTYTTATLRQANGSASNQLNFVQGVAEDSVSAQVNGMVSNSSPSVNAEIAIGVNSTTTATGPIGMIGMPSNGVLMGGSISYNGIPGVGRQFLVWLEAATATGTATWTGVNGINQTGITGSMMG